MTAPTGSWVMDEGIWRGLHGAADVLPTGGGGGGGGGGGPGVPAAPTYAGAGPERLDVGQVTVPWPTGHLTNDIGILVVETCAQTIATPSGWTAVTGSPWLIGTAATALSAGLLVFWRRATSSAMSNVVVPDSGDHDAARIFAVRGCITTGTPIDSNIASGTNGTASNIVSIPSFTTQNPNELVFAIAAYGGDSAADNASGTPVNGALTGIAIQSDTDTGAGFGGGFIVATGVMPTADVTGNTVFTLLRSEKAAYVQFGLIPDPSTVVTPPTGTGRTMFGSEGFDTNPSLIGTAVTPDTLISDTSASAWTTATTGWLDRLTNNSACAIMKIHPSNNAKNGDGTWKLRDDATLDFSPTKWKGIWDSFWAALGTSGQTKLRTAVANGNIRALYVLDDFVGGAAPVGGVPKAALFTHAVTYDQIEDICAHVKIDAPWLPLFARGGLDAMRSKALQNGVVRQYVWLDGGMCAYRPSTDHRVGSAAKIASLIQAGKDCSLAAFGWNNILNWGTGDSTLNGGFGCISGDRGDLCGESPSEVLEAIRAVYNAVDANGNSACHGLIIWAYNFGPTYWGRSDIQASLSTIASEIVGRDEGPNNIRTGANKHLDPA